jgi:hypothetical protein
MNSLLDRAIVILQAMPAVKFVIVLPDGKKYEQGDLQLEKAKRKRRNLKYPMGSVALHYKPYIANLQPKGLIEIPFDIFDAESLRSGIASHCVSAWGKGSVLTSINRSKRCVEVLRIA